MATPVPPMFWLELNTAEKIPEIIIQPPLLEHARRIIPAQDVTCSTTASTKKREEEDED